MLVSFLVVAAAFASQTSARTYKDIEKLDIAKDYDGCVDAVFDEFKKAQEHREIYVPCISSCLHPEGHPSMFFIPAALISYHGMENTMRMFECTRSCKNFIRDQNHFDNAFFQDILLLLEKCAQANGNGTTAQNARYNQFLHGLELKPPQAGPHAFGLLYPMPYFSYWAAVREYPNNCKEMSPSMNQAVTSYYMSLAQCQFACYAKADVGIELFDLYTGVAAFIDNLLMCQRECLNLMSVEDSGIRNRHWATTMYHYLQYCDFLNGDVDSARENAGSYTYLSGTDQSVYDYYKSKRLTILPSAQAQYLMNMTTIFDELVQFSSFMVEGTIEVPTFISKRLGEIVSSNANYQWITEEKDPDSVDERGRRRQSKKDRDGGGKHRLGRDVKVTNLTQFGGTQRLVIDNVASQAECEILTTLNKQLGVKGDGYSSSTATGSPYTENESFVGVNIRTVTEAVAGGTAELASGKLLYRLSGDLLTLAQEHFPKTTLYFDYTHLVCRANLAEEGSRRAGDLSHPLHSDNCVIQADGTCDPAQAPYPHRSVSALLYLSDHVTGGEFFFSNPKTNARVKVKPKCGRMVLFDAAEYHGVLPIQSGERCAVAVWFTGDPSHDEAARLAAAATLGTKIVAADEEEVFAAIDDVINGPDGQHHSPSDL